MNLARCGSAGHGKGQRGKARLGLATQGEVRMGKARQCTASLGGARLGKAQRARMHWLPNQLFQARKEGQ